MKQEEIWKDIPGYEGRYAVSNYGRVKRLRGLRKTRNNGVAIVKEQILVTSYSKKGYKRITLSDNDGKLHAKSVHRLVALAFIPNPYNLPQINHLNEKKDDNRVSNLEWCNASHNNTWGTRIERIVEKVKHPLIATNVYSGEKLYFESFKDAVHKGFHPRNISQKQGVRYSGYVWQYANDKDFVLPKIIGNRKKIQASSIVDGKVLSFCSIREAARNGFNRNAIKRALNSDVNKIYKDYYWSYNI